MNRRLALLLAALMLPMLLLSCGGKAPFTDGLDKDDGKGKTVDPTPVDLSGEVVSDARLEGRYELCFASEALELYAATDNRSIAVKDRRTGYIWESSVDPDRLSRKPNKRWSAYISSLFLFDYALITDTKGDIQTGSAAEHVTSVTRTAVPGGFALSFKMDALKLGFTIEFCVNGDALTVTIPEDSIIDGEKNYLVAIDLMPFFGASADTDDGYYLYPNGPGELYRFKDVSLRQNSLKEYVIPYYSPHTVNMADIERNDAEHTLIEAMLPVYGVKIGDSAFAAVLEEGAAYSALNIAPGGVAISLNRIFNTFVYRKSYGVYGSSISIGGGSQVFPLAVLLDSERYPGDRKMRYIFLAGESADYSGMAGAVRERYIESGMLPEKALGGDKLPVVLDILGGITEQKLFFTFFKKLTTFDEARQIAEELSGSGVENLIINLRGWGKKGLLGAPANTPASMKLGGKRGLMSLADACNALGVKLFLEVNYVDVYDGNGGYSLASDVARDPNNYMYTNSDKNHYLMSPASALTKTNELLDYIDGIGVSGITFERVGRLVYSDHHRNHASLADTTIRVWSQMLKNAAKKVGGAAASGGNLYVVKDADILMDIPDRSVSVLFGDETVPFYQMVVHGSVYYTGTQVNLFYDSVMQKLKMIEYGYIPYYELTWVSSRELSGTDYNVLFSSEYEHWKDHITSLSAELSENLGDTYGAYMTRHEKLADGVYKVSYDNGREVYINYTAQAWSADGIIVPGGDYVVIGGESAS